MKHDSLQLGALYLVEEPADAIISQRGSAAFRCRAAGRGGSGGEAEYSISWLKNGQPLLSNNGRARASSDGHTLHIVGAAKEVEKRPFDTC